MSLGRREGRREPGTGGGSVSEEEPGRSLGITNGARGEGRRAAACGGEGWQALRLLCFSQASRSKVKGSQRGGGGGAGGWQKAGKVGTSEEQQGGGQWSVGGQPAHTGRESGQPACFLAAAYSCILLAPLSLLLFLPYLPPRSLPGAFSRCPSSLLPPHPHGCLCPLPPLFFLMSLDPLSCLPSALASFFFFFKLAALQLVGS